MAELPDGQSFEEMGAGMVTGIILGVALGIVAFSYVFFVPYFHRRLVKNDARMRAWHIPLGPLLYRENPPIYWPGTGDQAVKDYYAKTSVESNETDIEKPHLKDDNDLPTNLGPENNGDSISSAVDTNDSNSNGTSERAKGGLSIPKQNRLPAHIIPTTPEPEDRWLKPVRDLPFYSPKKIANWTKYLLLQGVSRDVVTQKNLGAVHARAIVYDNRVEHLRPSCIGNDDVHRSWLQRRRKRRRTVGSQLQHLHNRRSHF
jgi:hypothetical protein